MVPDTSKGGEAMKLISSAFQHGGKIPSKHTCDGPNVSPPLRIEGVPGGTKSLVLIMDDPDVPKSIRQDGMWDHWVVYDIPPMCRRFQKARSPPAPTARAQAVIQTTSGLARRTGSTGTSSSSTPWIPFSNFPQAPPRPR